MSNIESILQDYQNLFNTNWFVPFNLTATRVLPPDRTAFANFLDNAKDLFFEKVNVSVLTGEYATDQSLRRQLSDLEDFVDSLIPLPNAQRDGMKILQNFFNKDFRESIKLVIKAYHVLFDQLQYRVQKNANKKLIIKQTFQFESKVGILRIPGTRQNVLFSILNIKVAIYDILMRPTEDNIDFLNNSISDLQSTGFGIQQHQTTLLLKCKYLLSKLILRGQIDDDEDQYILNAGVLSIVDPKIYISNDYDLWYKYSSNHYELSPSWQRAIKNEYNSLKSIPISRQTFQQLHATIKYLKEISKDHTALDPISEYLIRKAVATSHTAEYSYVWSVACSYAINNQFSLLIDDNTQNIEEIEKFHKKILEVQSKTGINNFFADFKYFEYLIERLDVLTQKKDIFAKLVEAREVMNKAYRLVSDYDERVRWCHENYNYVYILPFKESMLSLSNSTFKIFLFSSFLIPLSKDKYQKDFEKNKIRLDHYKASLDVLDNISKDVGYLKDEVSEHKNRDSKSMEIIGIFTAIVTFVAGTLQSFKFISTPVQAFFFMLAFGSALSLFLFLLIVVNRQDNIRNTRRFLWGFVTTILLFWGTLAWFYTSGKNTIIKINKSKELPIEKKDSLLRKNSNHKLSTYQNFTVEFAKMINETLADTSKFTK